MLEFRGSSISERNLWSILTQLPYNCLFRSQSQISTFPHGINSPSQSGRYMEFKAMQEDLILMIKNAHYFNEPGSVLHKKASTMRKCIISKGAELWRKYQLGQSQMQVLLCFYKLNPKVRPFHRSTAFNFNLPPLTFLYSYTCTLIMQPYITLVPPSLPECQTGRETLRKCLN